MVKKNPEEMFIKPTEFYHWKDFTISNLIFFFNTLFYKATG